MDMPTRKAALGRFRASTPQSIFVMTDEVARSLEPDILAVPLVVSYEMPSIGNYVPRYDEPFCFVRLRFFWVSLYLFTYRKPFFVCLPHRVKWIDRSNGKVGVKVVLIDGQRGEGQALRAIQSHYRTSIEDMPVSQRTFLLSCVSCETLTRDCLLTL
jgi:hypothetical protein